jgi:pimeloyl-ACP methyl ester carboxylesterase
MRVRTFELAFEGLRLHAEACSPGNNEADNERDLLFLHGGGAATSSKGTRYLREDLAALGVHSVALDFSGHGRSGGRIEDACLERRRQEALRLVEGLQLPRPRALVATSMAGHVACRLLETLRPDALVLFCPAAYEAAAEKARFGEPFRAVIRATRHHEDSPALQALQRFRGRVLCFYGSEDAVIPPAVQQGYARASACARTVDLCTLDGAGHSLHGWIAGQPALRRAVVERIMNLLQ